MKYKNLILLVVLALILIVLITGFYFGIFDRIVGKAVSNEEHAIGPSAAEQSCMMACMKCSSPGVNCTGNQQECQTKCNAKKPEATQETSCMEKCVAVGCGEFDFTCQEKNKDNCEKECNMIKDKSDESEMSAEQICITNCVAETDPDIRCGASQTGETGGGVCQRCASSCVHLYEGPCLDDEKLKAKQKECETCEHCYGEPVTGDSGEGWECIVDVQCNDASAEFGDDPGTGPGIVKSIGNTVGNVAEAIGNFFSRIFSREKSSNENTVGSEPE